MALMPVAQAQFGVGLRARRFSLGAEEESVPDGRRPDLATARWGECLVTFHCERLRRRADFEPALCREQRRAFERMLAIGPPASGSGPPRSHERDRVPDCERMSRKAISTTDLPAT